MSYAVLIVYALFTGAAQVLVLQAVIVLVGLVAVLNPLIVRDVYAGGALLVGMLSGGLGLGVGALSLPFGALALGYCAAAFGPLNCLLIAVAGVWLTALVVLWRSNVWLLASES